MTVRLITTTILIGLLHFSSTAQIKGKNLKIPKKNTKIKTEKVETTDKNLTPESPAKSDINMAEFYINSLKKRSENGEFEKFSTREKGVLDDLNLLKERLEKIKTVDPNYDLTALNNSYQEYQALYQKHKDAYDAKQQAYLDKQDSIKNVPLSVKQLEKINSWGHFIAFSSTPITSTEPVEKEKEFISGDEIFARAYFKKPVGEVLGLKKYYMAFEVNNEIIYTDDYFFSATGGEQYLDIDVVLEKGRRVNRLRAFNRLPNGKHDIKVYFGVSHHPTAENAQMIGSFTLNVTDAGKAKWDKIVEAYDYSLIDSNDPPEVGMRNSAVENAAIKFYKEKNFGGGKVPYKAYVTSSDWTIKRTASGAILYRHISVAVFVKIDDKVCEYSTIGIKQDYNGGSYGTSQYNGIGSTLKVFCSKVK
ncbi:MAG: hypothetical protein ACWA41_10625 [Putridiphycobacter sp.]